MIIPGVGKTTLALAFARALDLKESRVQFTPDVLPSDLVGFSVYQKETGKFVYHAGAVMCNLFLGDEINRTSSRTQSALRVFGQEDDTARMIAARLANISVAENIESALESVRESLGITLSQKQEQAVRTAFQHGLTIITGSPGTGKTTVLKAIIEVFKNLHPKGKFALMAPTGRASRRMAESTGVDEARTLHSALGGQLL